MSHKTSHMEQYAMHTSSQLISVIFSVTFSHFHLYHFLAFLHLIAFLFGSSVLYTDNFQDLGSCLVSLALYLGLARSVTSAHMV